MERSKYANIIVSVFLVIILVLGFIKNDSLNTFTELLNRPVNDIEKEYTSEIWNQTELVEINGFMAKCLNMQGLYSDMGMYVTDDKYIVSASSYTSTDYEVEETVALRDFLKDNGINLLYVNKPTKYTDDSLFMNEFGTESYSNRNADEFLKRIREAGVNTIDLRDNIRDEGISVSDLFYRTDHHWTVPAALWATGIIAEGLNEYCGYDIDVSQYDISNFDKREWKQCWLGEQGRKVGKSYVGLDDYVGLTPKYPTDYSFKNGDGTTYDGTFSNFISEYVYDTEADVHKCSSWHFSYNRLNCINNNIKDGKVLIVGDSYDFVTQPFLSLQVHEVDSIILRDYDDSFSLRDYIKANDYDTVIVAYAQFMIGAHDDRSSDNYRMFSFDH